MHYMPLPHGWLQSCVLTHNNEPYKRIKQSTILLGFRDSCTSCKQLKITEKEMAKYTCILLCVALVAGEQVYRFLAVTLDTPENMMCPPDSQLETARDSISANLSEILLATSPTLTPFLTVGALDGDELLF